ncbi:MAG: class I SAM-dependent methyltransferase family protein [Candidatus Aenigmarchaeota archaeon]|nr:class I SAM-dependent methyltransferase family protein [Candidatus Aenigmarchaeota archaeon]
MRLRELLEDRFTEDELKHVRGSFDIVGDACIIEIPDEIIHRKKDIINAIREIHPNLKTIYRKVSERKGAYRLRELELIYGEAKEVTHREHGCIFRFDPRKVYFSPRESTERQRIAKLVNPNEVVMVMFAGAGPYAITIAKKRPKVKKVYAIELNPDAYKYMIDNIRINKVGDKVLPILGDVEIKCPDFFGKCDRVVMPLPKGAYQYLTLAAQCLKKKGGFVHYYFWSSDEAIDDIKEIVKADIESVGRKVKKMDVRKVLPYAPKTWKFCMDVDVR